ncbi:SWIM zinc finger domain-containing protein [Paenibacillus sp. GCM10027626]|uniref:SWIM zinc finger family protein n=1 Tax=Paenibacillus sp. GCM10027626 TaxID=3273411 RepID=UPI00363A6F3A
MITLTESYIDALAPNDSAVKNGRGLVKKRSFVQLNKSEDGTLLFAECKGSGSSNYQCSADFIDPDKPVFRCSCPSRQFPCKHGLGLLYAYAGNETFEIAPIPEDILSKREKVEKREEQKAQKAAEGAEAKPKKVNKSALKKKITAQLEGLDLLEKVVDSLVRGGLGTIDKKTVKVIDGHVKQLGNYYLPGAQTALRRLVLMLAEAGDDREAVYTEAMEQLTVMHALIKKGRATLSARLETPDMKPDHETTIEEWLGHAWQLSDLKECGLTSENVELVQLSFQSYNDAGRQEFVDLGFWLDLAAGDIHKTLHYRPYKAAKHIREEDSFFEVAAVKELYRYPGDLNRRVRWESLSSRPLQDADYAAIASAARRSYADVVKLVKNQLKNPLADKRPVLLLHVASAAQTAEGTYVIGDEQGQYLTLGDAAAAGSAQRTTHLLPYLEPELLANSAMLVMFHHCLDSGQLLGQPLSVIGQSRITRLLY